MQAELIETSAVVDTFSVNYAAIKFEFKPQNSTYEMHNHWSAADSFEYRFIRGAQVDYFLKLQGIDGDVTDVVGLPGLPDTFAHNVQLDPVKDETRVVSRVAFDQPVRVIAPDGREIIVDAIEVSTIQNNLRQMTIGLHTVHVERSHGAGGGGGAGKVHFSDLSAAW
jgi:hypothetical protein